LSHQAQLPGHGPCLVEHDTVGLEHRVDVPSSPTSVIGQSHRRATEHVDIGDYATAGQPVTEPPERLLDRLAIQEWIIEAHATSNS
jgi:hypothetical protein